MSQTPLCYVTCATSAGMLKGIKQFLSTLGFVRKCSPSPLFYLKSELIGVGYGCCLFLRNGIVKIFSTPLYTKCIAKLGASLYAES